MIDTKVRHVTKPGANLFLELGFPPEEAKRLRAASRKQINDTKVLKQQLMDELSVWIVKHQLNLPLLAPQQSMKRDSKPALAGRSSNSRPGEVIDSSRGPNFSFFEGQT